MSKNNIVCIFLFICVDSEFRSIRMKITLEFLGLLPHSNFLLSARNLRARVVMISKKFWSNFNDHRGWEIFSILSQIAYAERLRKSFTQNYIYCKHYLRWIMLWFVRIKIDSILIWNLWNIYNKRNLVYKLLFSDFIFYKNSK